MALECETEKPEVFFDTGFRRDILHSQRIHYTTWLLESGEACRLGLV